ncbi:MAG TPA: galactose-1-epimerase [Firmicutes bacterium]|jgi:aldose 1-epimerase|nr:galactose-1-epimerase [Bacillota bacterium]
MNITKELFGKTIDGKEVWLYTLSNNHQLTVKIMTYGGIITSITTPDKNGKLGDIVLGFNNLKDYQGTHPFFGALIGRYGNRIAKGRFTLNGQEYKLAVNDGQNHLHGGLIGFDKVIWEAKELKDQTSVGLRLTYLSKDGEEGYPGNLTTTVSYLLNDQNELAINYEAVTDKPTVLNLTNHSYFNLQGEGSGDVLGHEMMIVAEGYTVAGEGLMPTGEIKSVQGTPFDFTAAKSLGAEINQVDGGYDHNFVLNHPENKLSLAARVVEPGSGRKMEVLTTQPGMQLYTGNFLDGTFKGKSGHAYSSHAGFCLETQHYPDSPNQPKFPSTVLNPGQTYHQVTIYKFSV